MSPRAPAGWDETATPLLDAARRADPTAEAALGEVGRRRVWRGIAERATRKRSSMAPWVGAGVLGGVAAAVVFLVVLPPAPSHGSGRSARAVPTRVASGAPSHARPAGPSRVDLGAAGRLEIAAGTRYAVEAPAVRSSGIPETRVVLSEGTIDAAIVHDPARRFVVITPEVRVYDVGTRFRVEEASGVTTVSVSEGRVRVTAPSGASVDLATGDTVRSTDPRLVAEVVPAPAIGTAPAVADSAVPSCAAAASLAARRACYRRLAMGDGVAAQNALYALALLDRDQAHDGERALADWNEYAHRFPDGLFAQETALGVLSDLLAESRYRDAEQAAARYLARFPDGERRGEVLLVDGNLRCEHLGDAAGALADYQQVLASGARDALVEEALFQKGRCLDLVGRAADARAAWEAYRARFPDGAHAAAVTRALGD